MTILSSIMNARTFSIKVNGKTKMCLRCAWPENITDLEIKWLKVNSYTKVIDLRRPYEVEKWPCKLQTADGFEYKNMPITVTNWESKEERPYIYKCMVDHNLDKIIEEIENSDSNVIFFCYVGKDRTGVLAAILQYRSNWKWKDIKEDYLKSGEELHDFLVQYAAENPQIEFDALLPCPYLLSIVISQYKKNHSDNTPMSELYNR